MSSRKRKADDETAAPRKLTKVEEAKAEAAARMAARIQQRIQKATSKAAPAPAPVRAPAPAPARAPAPAPAPALAPAPAPRRHRPARVPTPDPETSEEDEEEEAAPEPNRGRRRAPPPELEEVVHLDLDSPTPSSAPDSPSRSRSRSPGVQRAVDYQRDAMLDRIERRVSGLRNRKRRPSPVEAGENEEEEVETDDVFEPESGSESEIEDDMPEGIHEFDAQQVVRPLKTTLLVYFLAAVCGAVLFVFVLSTLFPVPDAALVTVSKEAAVVEPAAFLSPTLKVALIGGFMGVMVAAVTL